MNIIIPMASKSSHFPESEFHFPKPLIEIASKTIIEHVVTNLSFQTSETRFIFVVSAEDCRKFYLHNTIELITDGRAIVLVIDREAKGSACSALMAIEHVQPDKPLLIANSDQIFDESVESLIHPFSSADAGVVTFDSVHPRWSYVRLDNNGFVVEAAEKKPISRNAIAGLYYFSRGSDFVDSAMQMIRKDVNIEGRYYIAPTLNQMVLAGKKIVTRQVSTERYHTLYTPQKIREYENYLLLKTTQQKGTVSK